MVSSAVQNFAVSAPGTVVAYHADSKTCSVKVGTHRLVPDEAFEDEDLVEPLPPLQNVPVCWPIGRGFEVVSSLEAGDPVLLVALDRDSASWRRTGQPSAPDDARTHCWANAVAIPGLLPDTSPFPEPEDAAALAGPVDFVFRAWSQMPIPSNPADATAVLGAMISALKLVYTGPTFSCAADNLKLGSSLSIPSLPEPPDLG